MGRKAKLKAPDPKEWLQTKLSNLEEEWRAGCWYGDLFESAYLCYLECLVLISKRHPMLMWESWKTRAQEKADELGVSLRPMCELYDEDRDGFLTEMHNLKELMFPEASEYPSTEDDFGGLADLMGEM